MGSAYRADTAYRQRIQRPLGDSVQPLAEEAARSASSIARSIGGPTTRRAETWGRNIDGPEQPGSCARGRDPPSAVKHDCIGVRRGPGGRLFTAAVTAPQHFGKLGLASPGQAPGLRSGLLGFFTAAVAALLDSRPPGRHAGAVVSPLARAFSCPAGVLRGSRPGGPTLTQRLVRLAADVPAGIFRGGGRLR